MLDKIGQNIKNLKYGDLSVQVDALVILNEVITADLKSNKQSLVKNADYLIETFSLVLYNVFDKQIEAIPLKFGKYFIQIVSKVCSIDFVVRPVEEKRLQGLVEQLLLKLLVPGLEHLGERQEGQVMFRNLNSSILRVLENCPPTSAFCIFLNLLRKYKGCVHVEKLPSIIVKCLLKVTKILPQIID